jgi:hypothetical protein
MYRSEKRRVQVLHPDGREVRVKVYFILCKTTGLVKCGVALRPKRRLAALQVGSPTLLELIADLDGNERRERAIHKRMAKHRAHGEWFHYVTQVRDIIILELTSHFWRDDDPHVDPTIIFNQQSARQKLGSNTPVSD